MNRIIISALLITSAVLIGKEQEINYIEGHWNTKYGSYVYVCGNKVNLREEPGLNSKIIEVLNDTDQVQIIKSSEVVEKINGNLGKWVLVKCRNSNHKGWIFDYYLAFTTKFEIYKNIKIKEISYLIGDTITKITCFNDGKFRCEIISTYRETNIENKPEIIDGTIMKYRNIVWFKKNLEQDDFPTVLYFDTSDKLLIEKYYQQSGDGNIVKLKY